MYEVLVVSPGGSFYASEFAAPNAPLRGAPCRGKATHKIVEALKDMQGGDRLRETIHSADIVWTTSGPHDVGFLAAGSSADYPTGDVTGPGGLVRRVGWYPHDRLPKRLKKAYAAAVGASAAWLESRPAAGRKWRRLRQLRRSNA